MNLQRIVVLDWVVGFVSCSRGNWESAMDFWKKLKIGHFEYRKGLVQTIDGIIHVADRAHKVTTTPTKSENGPWNEFFLQEGVFGDEGQRCRFMRYLDCFLMFLRQPQLVQNLKAEHKYRIPSSRYRLIFNMIWAITPFRSKNPLVESLLSSLLGTLESILNSDSNWDDIRKNRETKQLVTELLDKTLRYFEIQKDGKFPTGAKVTVGNRTGEILRYLPETGRFSVRVVIMTEQGERIKILSLNLYGFQKLRGQKQRNRAALRVIFKLPEEEAVPKLLELLSTSLGVAQL